MPVEEGEKVFVVEDEVIASHDNGTDYVRFAVGERIPLAQAIEEGLVKVKKAPAEKKAEPKKAAKPKAEPKKDEPPAAPAADGKAPEEK